MNKLLVDSINKKIHIINQCGCPVIFVITGTNGSGKTRLAKTLYKELDFFNLVNLGVVTKLVRFFNSEIELGDLENASNSQEKKIINKSVEFIVTQYGKTGVNTIIDGVQADIKSLTADNNILGGVILLTSKENLVTRGKRPETHFLRKLKALTVVKYQARGRKFKFVDNNGSMNKTVDLTATFLNKLLNERMTKLKNVKNTN